MSMSNVRMASSCSHGSRHYNRQSKPKPDPNAPLFTEEDIAKTRDPLSKRLRQLFVDRKVTRGDFRDRCYRYCMDVCDIGTHRASHCCDVHEKEFKDPFYVMPYKTFSNIVEGMFGFKLTLTIE